MKLDAVPNKTRQVTDIVRGAFEPFGVKMDDNCLNVKTNFSN